MQLGRTFMIRRGSEIASRIFENSEKLFSRNFRENFLGSSKKNSTRVVRTSPFF
jgi:hypothetical protein